MEPKWTEKNEGFKSQLDFVTNLPDAIKQKQT